MRSTALNAFEFIGNNDSRDTLIQMLDSKDTSEGTSAIKSLTRLGKKDIDEKILELYQRYREK